MKPPPARYRRPSKARALQANYSETEIVMDLVLAWASEMKRDGKLSDDDVYFD